MDRVSSTSCDYKKRRCMVKLSISETWKKYSKKVAERFNKCEYSVWKDSWKKNFFLILQNFLKSMILRNSLNCVLIGRKNMKNCLEEKSYLNRVQIRHKKYWENHHERRLEVKLFFRFYIFLEPLSYCRYFLI